MRRVRVVLLAVGVCLGLAGCSDGAGTSTDTDTGTSQTAVTAETAETAETSVTSVSKTAVTTTVTTAPEKPSYGFADSFTKAFAEEVLGRDFAVTLTDTDGSAVTLQMHGSDLYCAIGQGDTVTAALYLIGSRMTAFDFANNAAVDGFRSGSPYDGISDRRILARLHLDGLDDCVFSADYDHTGRLTETFSDNKTERTFVIDKVTGFPTELTQLTADGTKHTITIDYTQGSTEILLGEHLFDPDTTPDLPIFL